MGKIWMSESVTGGHPDKVADLISDTVLDLCLEQDSNSRVACETLVKDGNVVIAGEITTKADLSALDNRVREAIKEIGYTPDISPVFNNEDVKITKLLSKQSPDIDDVVGNDGAGDQGFMIGYAIREAVRETNFMPLPIYLAHSLTQELTKARRDGRLKWLRPDGKSQVTVSYENEVPLVTRVTVAAQHADSVSNSEIREGVLEEVVKKVITGDLFSRGVSLYDITIVNGGDGKERKQGRFVIGGPEGDTGLTGRKIIVDTYGGRARHGGGAFSGKDATKVDRSAAYMARYIAKNLVVAGFARECEVHLGYAIGVAEPTGLEVETFGSSAFQTWELREMVKGEFPLKPREIINHLDLTRPIYTRTTNYGHFGRNGLPWEDTKIAQTLKEISI